jgi:hypothetical protein
MNLVKYSPYLILLGSMALKARVRMYQPELITIELKRSFGLLGMIGFSFSIVTCMLFSCCVVSIDDKKRGGLRR